MEPGRELPVLHLVNRFWIGGAERQFVERLRRHPKGFRPLVGCLELSGPLLPEVRALGLAPHLFPLRGSMLRANTVHQVARLAALIRSEGVRLVHGTDFNTNLLGLAAARLAGVRAVVSRVDLGHLREGFGQRHRQAERLNARLADLVIANARAVREVCIREEGCAPENVVVVRNGLDLAAFDRARAAPLQAPLPLPDGAPFVAVIGNLWPVKNHALLVEAAVRLHQRFPEVRFLCAGEGPERPALEGQLDRAGLSDTVHLLGHRLDVPAILARASALVLCSRAEGLSNALMEAMAAALPCVATSVGGNPELVQDGETGYLVPPDDPVALAERLALLFEDPERARAFGRAGRARVERDLTLQRMAEGHGAAYRRALGLPSHLQAA